METRAAWQWLLACTALLCAQVHAQEKWDYPEEKRWAEAEVKLPPFPKPGNLIQFVPDLRSNNRFYIDPDSISTGSDGVVRYTLVVKAGGGAENVSHEGMRCRTLEVKPYAYGQRDGTWNYVRTSEWRRFDTRNPNLHRVLFWDYFCPDRSLYGNTPKDAINRFKNGPPVREQTRGNSN
jgi:hypothetical protein